MEPTHLLKIIKVHNLPLISCLIIVLAGLTPVDYAIRIKDQHFLLKLKASQDLCTLVESGNIKAVTQFIEKNNSNIFYYYSISSLFTI